MVTFDSRLKKEMRHVPSTKARRMFWHFLGLGILAGACVALSAIGAEHLLKECGMDLLLEESARFVWSHFISMEG